MKLWCNILAYITTNMALQKNAFFNKYHYIENRIINNLKSI